jgi:hypothetical protein
MASTYINRTVTSAGNQKTFTISFWLKKLELNASGYMLAYGTNNVAGDPRGYVGYDGNNIITISFNPTGSSWSDYIIQDNGNNIIFRDVNAWYHIVVAVDTTQSTASDRLKVYVNGSQKSFASYPSQNFDTGFNSTRLHEIGSYPAGRSNGYLNGYLAHYHFIDGTTYDASAFGETDATTGIWIAKLSPSVTYGTNGFFLKFNEGSLGTDSSPNGNNFTVNGSLTPAKDTPTNVFTTWNSLENYYQSATLSNGNTTIQTGNSQYSPSSSTLGVSSGKWYWEVEYDALSGGSDVAYVGVLSQFATNSTTSLGTNANDYGYYVNGNYYNNNTGTAYGTTYTTGDIIGVALDLDNNKLYFSKNGTWQNSGDPESGATGTGAISITNPASTTNGAYFASICDGSSSANATFKTNFGNGYFGTTAVASAGSNGNGAIFEFDCPSGYYALNTKNINTYG